MAEAATVQSERTQAEQPETPIILMEAVNKWYGTFHVLKDIDLSVAKGERIVICGPSGSGKSTLIRCINRLEEHQRGRIVVDGIELNQDVKHIEQVRREVADRLCFFHEGRILEEGTPAQMVGSPRFPETRTFLEAVL
jgi:general L-amino acid transport system ATP-binding protein